jgi:chromosome segregation ATPase
MTQGLQRGLFGYRREDVERMLADRRSMFDRAVAQAREAEERAEALEAQLEELRTKVDVTREGEGTASSPSQTARLEEEIAEERSESRRLAEVLATRDADASRLEEEVRARETRIRELEAEVGRLNAADASRPEGDASAEDSPTPELDRALGEVERQIAGIVDHARRSAHDEIVEVERRREMVRTEVDELVAYRDRLSPAAADVRRMLDEATQRARETEAALRTLLEPVATSVTAIQVRLADLAGDAWPVEVIEDEPVPDEPRPVDDAVVGDQHEDPPVSSVTDIDDSAMTEDASDAVDEVPASTDDPSRDVSLVRVDDDEELRRLRW